MSSMKWMPLRGLHGYGKSTAIWRPRERRDLLVRDGMRIRAICAHDPETMGPISLGTTSRWNRPKDEGDRASVGRPLNVHEALWLSRRLEKPRPLPDPLAFAT